MTKEDKITKIKKQYEEIRKKYKLPKFEEIDKEFELRSADANGFIIAEIRRAISHKTDVLAGVLTSAIDPHPQSLHCMVESGAFNKDEREVVFKLYKKLGYFGHKAIVAALQGDEATIEFIKEVWDAWPSIKKDTEKYMKKIVAEWKTTDVKPSEKAEYLG